MAAIRKTKRLDMHGGEHLHHVDVGPGFGGMPLGQQSEYADIYTPSLLCPLLRTASRAQLDVAAGLSISSTGSRSASDPSDPEGLGIDLPFVGEDVWTAYELTWIDARGRPQSALARVRVPCRSPCMVESKSMKLYLMSLAQTKFGTRSELLQTINSDLTLAFRSPVIVELLELDDTGPVQPKMPGVCIDELDVDIDCYERNPDLLQLKGGGAVQTQSVYTNQFRSLCPVTRQPDFASIWIEYSGAAVQLESLYQYLVSYRTHSGFHETTVEQIFLDLNRYCGWQNLTVYGRFMRRGGIDINPFRSTSNHHAPLWRLPRQ